MEDQTRSVELTEQGIAKVRAESFTDAAVLFTLAIEQWQENHWAWDALARCQLYLRETEAAIKLLTQGKIVCASAGPARIMVTLSEAYQQSGKFVDATRELEEAREIAPRDCYVLVRLGYLYHATARLNDAATAFRTATQVNPEHYKAWLSLAKVYGVQGKLQECVQALRTAVSVDQTDFESFLLLAIYLEQTGKYEESTVAYDTAIGLDELGTKAMLSEIRNTHLIV